MDKTKYLYRVDKTYMFVPNSRKRHKEYFAREPVHIRYVRQSKNMIVEVFLTNEQRAGLEAKGCTCERIYR